MMTVSDREVVDYGHTCKAADTHTTHYMHVIQKFIKDTEFLMHISEKEYQNRVFI